jgi:hypothetical protein
MLKHLFVSVLSLAVILPAQRIAMAAPRIRKDSGAPIVSSSGTPTIQVRNPRKQGQPETFQVAVDIHCDADCKPAGELSLSGLNLDGQPSYSRMVATAFPTFNSTGGNYPTIYLSGPCTIESATGTSSDCRYWVMFAGKTVGYSISRQSGELLSAGVGSLDAGSGKITAAPRAD